MKNNILFIVCLCFFHWTVYPGDHLISVTRVFLHCFLWLLQTSLRGCILVHSICSFKQQTHRFFCFVLLHITPQWMTYVNIILVTECAKPHLCISCQNSWNPILCPGALNSLCHLGNQTSLIPASISPALNLSTGHGLSKISVLIFPLVWGWFFLALTALPGPRCCETPEEPSTLPPLPHFLPEEFEEVIPQFIWSFPDCYFAWMVLLFIMKISNSRKE